MDISIVVRNYLCGNFNYLDEIKSKYKNKISLIKKILSLIRNTEVTNNEQKMKNKIKYYHFIALLNTINLKYINNLKKINEKFYEEKKYKFINVINIFKDYIINQLKNVKNKDCNQFLLYNYLLEENIDNSISKFNIDKFYEIINLVCDIISTKKYLINYSKNKIE